MISPQWLSVLLTHATTFAVKPLPAQRFQRLWLARPMSLAIRLVTPCFIDHALQPTLSCCAYAAWRKHTGWAVRALMEAGRHG